MTRLAPPALPELADESKSQELGRNSLGRKKKKKKEWEIPTHCHGPQRSDLT